MRGSRRLIALDLLRAFAVLLVLGRHLHPLDFTLPGFLQEFTRRWANCGWMGVDLFFVLSGFLVSGLLFQEYQRHGKIRVGRFLVRRAFKIYPPFYVFIAIVIYIQYSNYNYDLIKTKQILAEAFFVQNYFPGLLDHTWSLGVEEHFYLLLPITLLVFIAIENRRRLSYLLPRYSGGGLRWGPAADERSLALDAPSDSVPPPLPSPGVPGEGKDGGAWLNYASPENLTHSANPFRRLPQFCIGVSATLLVARILTHYWGKYEDRHNLMPTHLRIDSLLCGVLLSYYYHFYSEQTLAFARRFRWPIIIAALVLLIPVYGHVPWDFFVHTYGFMYAYAGFALLLLVALTLPIPRSGLLSLPFRAVAFCGTYSYGIYLWHMPVKLWGAMYLTRWFGWTISARQELLIYVGGSFLVGIVFSMIIEIPFLALRDWWFPSKSGAVEPSEWHGRPARVGGEGAEPAPITRTV